MRVISRRLNFEALIVGDLQYYSSVILYLHGSKTNNQGINSLFEESGFATLLHTKQVSFSIPFIAPCSLHDSGLTAENVTGFIDDLREQYDIQHIHLVGLGHGGEVACQLARRSINFASVTLMDTDLSPSITGDINCPTFILQSNATYHEDDTQLDTVEADSEVDITFWRLAQANSTAELVLSDHWRTWLAEQLSQDG